MTIVSRFLIALGVIAAAGMGGFFISQKYNGPSEGEVSAMPVPAVSTVVKQQDESISNRLTIRIDEEGFHPRELTIKAGETVTFLNRDKDGHWPASNIHPTHAIYPAFDPKKNIDAGVSWSFTFERPGEWRYHDHIFPDRTGVIIVVEGQNPPRLDAAKQENTPPKKIFRKQQNPSLTKEAAQSLLAKINMFEAAKNETRLGELLSQAGARAVMDDLLLDSGGGSTIDCHQEAHLIGRLAYEQFGASAFQEGDASCHSGFYHGALEAFLAEKGTINLAKNVEDVCNAFPTLFGRFECLHGIGHGLMAYEDYDLPQTLRTCDLLATDYDRSSCYGGVFMENIVAAQGFGAIPGHDTKWANNDPHFPCNAIDQSQSVQFQCYQMQTSWMLTLFSHDFDRVIPECLLAPANMISVCFKSFGRDAAGHTLRNPQKIRDICEKVPQDADYYRQCVIGAINVIVDFWGDGLTTQGTELCKTLPEKGKEPCYATLASRLRDIFKEKEKRSAMCTAFEPAYQNRCGSS